MLAKIEGLPPLEYMFVLMISAAAVVTILYLGSSQYLLFYGTIAVGSALALPIVLEPAGIPPIPKLQPTLLAETVMVLIAELNPRSKNSEPKREDLSE